MGHGTVLQHKFSGLFPIPHDNSSVKEITSMHVFTNSTEFCSELKDHALSRLDKR